MTIDYSQLPLGKQTAYCDQYDAALLVAVPRVQTRHFLPDPTALPFCGTDHWTGYELSWLGPHGKPQVACLLLDYDALTPNIVESKSLKLYLNSYNQTHIESAAQLQSMIASDVSQITGGAVNVTLLDPVSSPDLMIRPWQDRCIDDLDIAIDQYQINASLLQCDSGNRTEQTLVSHLLRSNCPVTGQPDWASVRIHYQGDSLREESLLRYICSFRLHQGFHEQCIERMFCDIWQQCRPERLSVEGRFTRRGGLDINPFRASHADMQPTGARQLRQ